MKFTKIEITLHYHFLLNFQLKIKVVPLRFNQKRQTPKALFSNSKNEFQSHD